LAFLSTQQFRWSSGVFAPASVDFVVLTAHLRHPIRVAG